MTVWCHLPTIFERRRALRIAALAILLVAFITTYIFAPVQNASADINRTINFQGRLLDDTGAVVPDGYYNIQFKIYEGGDGLTVGTTGTPAGTPEWTETRINDGTLSGVRVVNGFLSVNLGDPVAGNPFGTDVDFNSDTLWLSMNVAGNDLTCDNWDDPECAADGEMLPMKRMTAAPYALNSGALGGKSADNFVQLAQGVQDDASTSTSSIFINKTGTGNLIQLQNTGTDIFTVSEDGDLAFGNNADHTITVMTAAASTDGNDLTVSAGTGGAGTGNAGGTLTLQGGDGGGTDGDAGDVTIDTGAATGTGAAGTVNIGAVNAGTIQIGNASLANGVTQNITIGGNAGGNGTQNVTIGSTANAAGGTTSIQSKDNTVIATNGTTRATFDTAGTLYLGDGVTSSSTGTFTIQGSTGAASSAGYTLALQGGTGGSGNANGGDVTLQGGTGSGTGVQGQVRIAAGGYITAGNQNFTGSGSITQANVDNYSSIDISADNTGYTITVPAPTTQYSGRVLYIQLTGSNSITLSPSGGSSTTMVPGTVYALVWNNTANGWLAAGTDSNGFIQNQNSTDQTANFRISGTGQANSGFLGPSLDSVSGQTALAIGGTNARDIDIGNTDDATDVLIQGGNTAEAISIQAKASGTISIGTANAANTLQIGSTTLSSGTQDITIGGANTAGGTQNVTIGSASGAAAGSTTIQSKDNTTITTNGTTRATFDTTGKLVLGDGLTSSGTGTFTLQGSTGAASSAGYTLALQGGTGGSGNANGGDITLQGGTGTGTGVQGLVKLASSGFTTAPNQHFTATAQSVTQANVDNYSAIDVSADASGYTETIPAPTTPYNGRLLYVFITGSNEITLNPSGGSAMTMTPNTSATLLWSTATNGWMNSGAGSGSGNYILNQNATDQDADFRIDGVGQANGGFLGPSLDSVSGQTALAIGGTNARDIDIGNTDDATTIMLQGGNTSTAIAIDAKASGTIGIGTANAANTIQIGSTTLDSGTQTINIGNNNTAGGTTDVTIGAGSSAAGGTTAIQSKEETTITTDGTTRATFDTNHNLYLGNGTTNATTGTFVIQGTGGNAGGTAAGWELSLQGGAGSTGGAGGNGGALTLQGGDAGGTDGDGGNVTIAAGTKTGTGDDGVVTVATSGVTRMYVDATGAATGKIYFGNGKENSTVYSMTLQGTSSTADGVKGASMGFQGGSATVGNANGGDVWITGGMKSGTGTHGVIYIGGENDGTINIGRDSGVIAGTQQINIGTQNATGTTNVTIGSAGGATSGNTILQAKGNILFRTNGTDRARFSSTGNTLYVGNADDTGVHATPNAFLIQGTSNSGTGAGGGLTIQAGNSGSSANGANLTLSGGTGGNGVNGLVVLTTPTFQTYNGGTAVACAGPSACNIPQASVDNNAVIVVDAGTTSMTVNMPDPSTGVTTYGRIIYITGDYTSENFTLSINGGGSVSNLISMRANASATLVWGPGDGGGSWTAAGASSSTTLQAAYDNTIQSSGGAELIVSKTSNTNGLTIRDSSLNPVDGALLAVQSNSAANLFSVNSNVTEYASNPGAESYDTGSGTSVFPTNTWSSVTGSTVSRNTTVSNIATGQGSVSTLTSTSAGSGVKDVLVNGSGTPTALIANNHYNVSFSTRLSSGTFTDMQVYYSIDGSAASVLCKEDIAVPTSVWTKVNCSFTAPSGGITASNAIIIRQEGGGTARTFYVDNLSVTIAADFSLVTDGGVDDNTNFATNWNAATAGGAGGTVTRDTADGQAASSSAKIASNPATAHSGIRNKLAINPLINTLYRVTVYAKATASFTDFKVRYSATGSQASGSSGYVDCVDYNTQTISTSGWTKVTCYIQTDGTTVTTPYLYFVQTAAVSHNFSVDTASMTIAAENIPNVQIGGGLNGGPTTLFTLDRGASAPVAGDNEALLGSMYYDTTLGKLQCYEADGWGACGSSPDNIVTISPEYTNAVMHGTEIGTLTSDFCSAGSPLFINDGSGGQPTICGAGETRNFYKWTTPQFTPQEYDIYVTYQLPDTFKTFLSGSTSVKGKTDSSNATVEYQIYKSDGGGLTPCGSVVTVATGNVTWQPGTATGASDPSTCGFGANNSIVFRINMESAQNANAYVSDLGFAFSNF